jgi:hypothetical protein
LNSQRDTFSTILLSHLGSSSLTIHSLP